MTIITDSVREQPNNLWLDVCKLSRLRWSMLINEIIRAKPQRKILYSLLMLLIVGVFIGTYLLSTYLFQLISSQEIAESGINLDAFLTSIPTLILSGAFVGLLVVSFGILLQSLYLANDMEFLLSSPVRIRAVFLTKLLQAILPDFVIISLFSLPILFGLGMVKSYNIFYFPFVILVLVFLSLAAAGISSLLVMVVVRFLPAKRVAEILALLAAVLFMLLSQWSNLTGLNSDSFTPEKLSHGTQILSKLDIAWSPLAWGGRGLIELGESHWLAGISFLALILVLCAGSFMLALNTAEHLYYSGWASMQINITHKKVRLYSRHRSVSRTRVSVFRNLLTPQVWAILLKDIKMLERDMRLMSKLIMPLIMGIVFAVMLLRGGEVSTESSGIPTFIDRVTQLIRSYGSMLVALLVGWMLILNISTNSFSMEGRSYWMIKCSPVSSKKQLTAKFLVAYLPTLILVWVYMIAIALLQGVSTSTLFYELPAVILILAGVVGINLAFGVRYANLDWTDPRHMSDGIGSYIAMIVSFVYMLICVIILLTPPIGFPMLGVSEEIGKTVGFLALSVACGVCTFIPLQRVKQRVYRIGEA
jgi:ABC-2 type transport system permease protein